MDPFEALEAGDPREVGRYRIVARLGAGGMGRVYLGRSPGGRAVAVKVVRPELAEDGEFRRRFAREVAAARRVNGVFTAGVVDADPDGSPAWLATAYVPGVPLGDAVLTHGPWPQEQVLALGAGLAEALEAIHAADVVHRDLKPSNILLAADGPRVIDFGISVAGEGTALTRTGTVVGTPGFMSPEQLTGKPVGPASDVFSLGAVLAFTATGAGPFGTGSAHALSFRVVYEDPDLSQLPPVLRTVVAHCLAKQPERRPAVAALLDQLADAIAATDSHAVDGDTDTDRDVSEAVSHTPTQPGWLPNPVAAALHARTTAHRPLAPQPDPVHLPTQPSPRRPENPERPENPDHLENERNPAPASAYDPAAEPGSGATPAAKATSKPPARAAKSRAGLSRRQALFGLGGVTAAGLGFLGWKSSHDGAEEPDAGSGSSPGSGRGAGASSASPSPPTPAGPSGVERWRFATGDSVYPSPTAADGIVYVGSDADDLYALDTSTGSRRWTFATGADVRSAPAVADGTVYVGSYNGNLYAVDAGTGKQRWKLATGEFGSPSPTVTDGVVYVGGRGEIVYRFGKGSHNDYGPGHVYAVDPGTGKQRWTFTTRSSVEAPPAVAGGVVYATTLDGTLYAVDAATGKQRWTFVTGGWARSSPAVGGGVVYVGSTGGNLYALDAATGRQRWKLRTGGEVSSPAVLDGVAYIGSGDGSLYAVDTRTGSQRWTFRIGKPVNSPAVVEGTVYVGSEDGYLYAVRAATGSQRWKMRTGSSVKSMPAVVDGTVYFGSLDGNLYAVWA